MHPLIFIIFIVIPIAVYLRVKKVSRYQKLTANIPEIKSFPIIGSVLEFGINGSEILQHLDNFMKKYGEICKGWLGPYLIIKVASPEIIGEILSNDKLTDKPFIYNFIFLRVDPSVIFVANGDAWRQRRKLITPSFRLDMLERYLDVFNSNSKEYVKELEREIGKSGFDVYPYNCLCTFDNIVECILGVKAGMQKRRYLEVVESIHELEKLFTYRGIRPWLYPNIMFMLSPGGKKTKHHMKFMYDFIEEMLKKKADKCNNEKSSNEMEDSSLPDATKSKEFSDILLYHEGIGTIQHKEVQDELLNMIAAGGSTSSSTLGFILYCLMKHQDVQEKASNELKSIFNGSDRDVTMADLRKMNYLDMVIKETFRLYTTVPFILREMKEDVHLKAGYVLPKGAFVLLFFSHMHRRADIYPNPDVFDPERFNRKNSSERNYYAFSPFSGGTRNCIGNKFGMIQNKIMLTHFLRKYKVLPPTDNSPDLKLTHEMVLNSSTGVNIRIEYR